MPFAITAVSVVAGVLLVNLVIRRLRGWSPSWSARAVQAIELEMSESEALRLAERSLQRLDLSDGPGRGGENGTIEATARGNWKTLGNRVEIAVQSLAPALTRLEIMCTPSPPQRFDWGRSREIVDQIVSDIRAD